MQIHIIPKNNVKGFEEYFFSSDDKLYNRKKNKEVVKKVKGYTAGYYLRGNFFSIKRAEQLKTPLINDDNFLTEYLNSPKK